MTMITCPHCTMPAELVTGEKIYPHRPDLASKYFWNCDLCKAYVGCHDAGQGQGDGTTPKGTLANAQTRQARRRAHDVFDPLWTGRRMRRQEAYRWLAHELGLKVEDCHIGEFDAATCQRVVEVVEELRMTS